MPAVRRQARARMQRTHATMGRMVDALRALDGVDRGHHRASVTSRRGILIADVLKFSVASYASAAELNQPPVPITPDPLPAGASSTDQLLRLLVATGNSGDADDSAAAEAGHQERSRMIADALAKFPATEERSVAMLAGLGGPQEDAVSLAGYGWLGPLPDGPITWCIQPGGASGRWYCSVLYPNRRVATYWSDTDDSGGSLP